MRLFRLAPALAASLLIVTTGLASAQQAPARPATPAPAAPSYAPSHLQAASEVVISSGMSRSFEALPLQVALQFKQTITLTRPELVKAFDESIEAMKPDFVRRRDEMVALAARVFASRLSETELKEINGFFGSAVGKKYVASQPELLDGMVNEMQTWARSVEETTISRLREEMKKKGHTI